MHFSPFAWARPPARAHAPSAPRGLTNSSHARARPSPKSAEPARARARARAQRITTAAGRGATKRGFWVREPLHPVLGASAGSRRTETPTQRANSRRRRPQRSREHVHVGGVQLPTLVTLPSGGSEGILRSAATSPDCEAGAIELRVHTLDTMKIAVTEYIADQRAQARKAM